MASHTEGSTKAIFYALGANGGIALAKFVAALFTGSGAMLAEAIHSLADCTNQVFLLIGLKEAQRPANDSHPMGYARVVYFWAMMVAILLFFVGGAFSVMEGIKHLRNPEPITNPWVAIGVLGISVVLEAFSLRGAMVEIRKISHGKSFYKWFRETRQSELMVVAGEDIAALAGLALAFVAVVMTVYTGNPLWDACGSIGVGLLLMIVAIIVIREVKAMVTGESATPELHAAIKAHIEAHPEIAHVMNLISMQWGHQIMIAVQAEMRPQPSDIALVDVINEIEAGIQSRWPQVYWCFFEPDRRKPPASVIESELSSYP
ncbi:cation diffusion facilitator family transporter [Glaciimonas immobilis]|uniref:Cation diffusion facilitator family transporter n=1 Tax=Glaciimonas immobilis TaxID=728004 RepID=A0A840RYB9_9BURK|nr:cation diffusion facilitator family transporter [Glaciimonas immobilis]KAF3996229.1 cation diffusion facilitator family transporter [Glaciimonas immobilis]MBB5202553.1 cation diffusion facilitator family transporter [Glaciimonas immobilis]